MDEAEYYYEPVTQINSEIRMGLSDTYQCSVSRRRVKHTMRVMGPRINDGGRRSFGRDCRAGAGESARAGRDLARRGCGDAAQEGLPAPNPPRQCRLCLPPRRAHQGLPRAAWVRPGVVLSTSLVHVLIGAADAYAAFSPTAPSLEGLPLRGAPLTRRRRQCVEEGWWRRRTGRRASGPDGSAGRGGPDGSALVWARRVVDGAGRDQLHCLKGRATGSITLHEEGVINPSVSSFHMNPSVSVD